MLGIHIVFNHINAKKDYILIRKWMKMTYEIPAESIDNNEVIGLSRKENKAFWQAEDKLNYRYLVGVVNACLIVISLVFDSQLFFVSFDVSLALYIPMQIINLVWNTFGIFSYLHGFYTLNTFFVTIIYFMSKKFRNIRRQIERMNASIRTAQINNRKLAQLIYEYNSVSLELAEMNNFFK